MSPEGWRDALARSFAAASLNANMQPWNGRPIGARYAVVWLPPLWGERRLAWPWYAPVGTVTTVAVALALNLLRAEHGPPGDRGAKPGLDKAG